MSSRTIGPASLLRLLGCWRSPGRGAAHRQLFETLRLLILDGRLPLALRLPGERSLARALGVSRTTVGAAYQLLRDDGFLVSRHGSGSVTGLPPGPRSAVPADDPDPGLIEFSIAALPANESVHRAYAAALAALPRHLPTTGYDASGLGELRSAVAERYTRLGLPTSPGQVLVTQGAQQGLNLVLRLLASPGDRVVVEHPTYSLALEAIRRASCTIVPVPLPESGWDSDAFAAAFRQTQPRLAFLQPDFQNPTGLLMDDSQREALAALAARHGCTLVVDETMSDVWLEGRRPTPFAAFDREGKVVSLGSTGKTYWGGLRIGWIRAEARAISALAQARASLDMGSPILDQLAAAALLDEDELSLVTRRETLRLHRDRLLALAADLFPDWRVRPPSGGLCLWAELPRPAATALAAAAEAQGLRIAPGPRFGIDGAFERFVRLPYSMDQDRLEEAMARLAAAWRSLDGTGRARRIEREAVPEPI